jgi:hypothetical protein
MEKLTNNHPNLVHKRLFRQHIERECMSVTAVVVGICRDSCWWTRRPIKGRGFRASTFWCKPVTLSKLCSNNRSRRNIRATAVKLSTVVDPIIADGLTTCLIVGQGGLVNVGQVVPPVHTGSRL